MVLQGVEKEPDWRHAIVTVATGEHKAAAMRRLAGCQIQGSQLQCSELVASGAPTVTVSSAPNGNLNTQGTEAGGKRSSAAILNARPAKQAKAETPKEVLICARLNYPHGRVPSSWLSCTLAACSLRLSASCWREHTRHAKRTQADQACHKGATPLQSTSLGAILCLYENVACAAEGPRLPRAQQAVRHP